MYIKVCGHSNTGQRLVFECTQYNMYSQFSVQSRGSLRLFPQMKRLRPVTRQYFIRHISLPSGIFINIGRHRPIFYLQYLLQIWQLMSFLDCDQTNTCECHICIGLAMTSIELHCLYISLSMIQLCLYFLCLLAGLMLTVQILIYIFRRHMESLKVQIICVRSQNKDCKKLVINFFCSVNFMSKIIQSY